MKLRMYSIYDKKTKLYHPPAFCHNAGHAMRVFKGVFFDKNSMMSRFPVDYDIYDLGGFDDNSGEVAGDKPTFICTLDSLNEINPQPTLAKESEDGNNVTT